MFFFFPSQWIRCPITWSLTGPQRPPRPVTARTPGGPRGCEWRPRWMWSYMLRTSSTTQGTETGRCSRRGTSRRPVMWETQRPLACLTATTNRSKEKVGVLDIVGCQTVINCTVEVTLELFVGLRHPEEQNQLPSPADRQEHEEPSAGEAEWLQLPHHHLHGPHQQQHHLLAASVLHQHHDPRLPAALAGLQRRRSSGEPREQHHHHQTAHQPATAASWRAPACGHLPGNERGGGHALEVRDGERRQRVWLGVSAAIWIIHHDGDGINKWIMF